MNRQYRVIRKAAFCVHNLVPLKHHLADYLIASVNQEVRKHRFSTKGKTHEPLDKLFTVSDICFA